MSESQETTPLDEIKTTASFVIPVRHVAWIRDEAKRRGLNKSELIRDLLDWAIKTETQATERAA